MKGLDVLNYIAWFNGSPKRYTSADLIENSLISEQKHEGSNDSYVQMKRQSSWDKFKQVLLDIKHLFGAENLPFQIVTLILSTTIMHLYYLCIFNSSRLKGNSLVYLCIFSTSETIGVFISTSMIRYIAVPKVLAGGIIMMWCINFIIKFGGVSEANSMYLFLVQSLCLGGQYNLLSIISVTIIKPHY